MTSKYKHWLPAVLYMAIIFYMSSRPSPEEVKLLPIIAKLKLVHIIEYGVLSILAWWAIIKTTELNKTEAFVLALAITVLYGFTDEFHQIFVVGRTCRFMDVVADGVGGTLAQAGISISSNYRS